MVIAYAHRPSRKSCYIQLCWLKQWYTAKVLSLSFVKGQLKAFVLPLGMAPEHQMSVHMDSGSVQDIAIPKRSLNFEWWHKWQDKVNIETRASNRNLDSGAFHGDDSLRKTRSSFLAMPQYVYYYCDIVFVE